MHKSIIRENNVINLLTKIKKNLLMLNEYLSDFVKRLINNDFLFQERILLITIKSFIKAMHLTNLL